MRHRRDVTPSPRKLAIVTGASGGLGFEIARLLAAAGYDLALVARSEAKLNALAQRLHAEHGVDAQVVALDLARPEAADALAARVSRCDVLVNNAGFATNAHFERIDETRIAEEITLDVLTLTRLTRKYLPGMIERRDGKILNVASTAGLLPGPFMAVYYAAKGYVISFSQALSEEMRGTGVTVSCFCPGAMETGFAARANTQRTPLFRMFRSDPAAMAASAVRGMQRGTTVNIPWPPTNWLVEAGVRLLPRRLLLWVSRKAVEVKDDEPSATLSAADLRGASRGTTAMPATSESTALDALADRYWQHWLATDYRLRSQVGLPVETIRPISYANAESDAAFAQGVLDGLREIDATKLDHDRWLTSRTLTWLATNDVATSQYFWLTQRATPYAGGDQLSGASTLLTTFQISSAADAQRYLSLMHQYATLIASIREFLQGQHERGIILPPVEIDASHAVFAGYAQPAQTGVLIPDDDRLQALSAGERAAFRARAETLVAQEIVPALQSVASYLDGPYRVAAPGGVGLSQYPGGAEYYRYLVVLNTTLTIAPEKLHTLGEEQVAKLNAELDGIRREVGFQGDVRAFKAYLAHDSRFYVKTTQAFGDRLDVYVARSAAAVPKYFLHTPSAPYGVAPLPKELAGSQTFGYYDQPTPQKPKGTYLYNAWHPDRASVLTAGALICHELIPGHHFQIALQQENTALPDLRRYDFSEVGFVEGWGEYASQLCWDMGVYESPYDKAGRIMQDLMVSVRLVVDTGMNAMGWSRERAMQYMRENLTLNESQIETESLRYSTDIPGQALAYKTGELTMLRLREHAREQLGDAFDIRKFHSWVIDSGSMTLDTLEQHVNYEIARQKNGNGGT